MRQVRVFLAVLVLAIAACTSVPREVRAAHDLSLTESKAAFDVAEDTMAKIETKSAELNDATVREAFIEWETHLGKVRDAREVVTKYLANNKMGQDSLGPYSIGTKLLYDMHSGFQTINALWTEMLKPERDADTKAFMEFFRRDIERFRIL